MKVITPLGGTAVVHVSIDDVMPQHGIIHTDLIESVKSIYRFNNAPVIQQNVPFAPIFVFQSGVLSTDKLNIPINQLTITPDGDGVTAQDTDAADEILTNYIQHMNNNFGYRYTYDEERLYYSILIVEFKSHFTSSFKAIDDVLARNLGVTDSAYSLKSLKFGVNADEIPVGASIVQLVPQEFVVERRASAAFEKNRFYCAAPLRTADHIRVLEEIEAALA